MIAFPSERQFLSTFDSSLLLEKGRSFRCEQPLRRIDTRFGPMRNYVFRESVMQNTPTFLSFRRFSTPSHQPTIFDADDAPTSSSSQTHPTDAEEEEISEDHPHKELFQQALSHVRLAMAAPDIASQRLHFQSAVALVDTEEHLSRKNILLLLLAGYEEDAHEYTRAKALVQQVLDSVDTPSWRPHYLMGRILLAERDFPAAYAALSKAVELGAPSFPDGDLHWTESLLLRARLNLQNGRADLALADVSNLLQEAPQHKSPYQDGLLLRAELSLRERASFDAVKDFGVVLSEDSGNVEAQVGRAVAYAQLLRREIARKDLLQAESVDTGRAYASLLRFAPCLGLESPAVSQLLQHHAQVQFPILETENQALDEYVATHHLALSQLFKQFIIELN